MGKVKITIRRFKATQVDVGAVRIGALKLDSVEVYEEKIKKGQDPLEVVLRYVERGTGQHDFVEIIADTGTSTIIVGEGRGPGRKRLSFRPERLVRVGIVRRSALKPLTEVEEDLADVGEPSVGAYRFMLDEAEWHDVDGDVYIYEGNIEVSGAPGGDVALLILETEGGRRYVRLSASSKRRRAARTRS